MILGVDASLTSTGYCVMEKGTGNIIEIGKITPNSKKLTEEERIFNIVNTISFIISKYKVTSIAMENQFLHKNPKTTMQLSRLRGALVYVMMLHKCSIEHLQPSSIRKMIMDNGSADKEDVAKFIQDKYKDNNMVVNLGDFCDRNCKAKNSDIYDAIAVALALKHITLEEA